MDLERKFVAAVDVIQNLPSNGPFQPSNEMKLKFYAYYKQATVGPCSAKRPSFWDLAARAKYDAWTELGTMEKTTAMTKYVDNLKQIIEAMNFSHDVENFMEALGPFYEEVEEKEINNQSNVVYQSTARHAQDNDIISSIVEESSMQQMIGTYDVSDGCLTDETSDSDFLNENAENVKNAFANSRRGVTLSELVDIKDNNNCPNKLFEELQKTRESLREARLQMENRSIDINISEECGNFGNMQHTNVEANVEAGNSKLSQRDIDRMLGNIDGFIPRPDYPDKVTHDENDEAVESGDETFEDSHETLSTTDEKAEHFDISATIISANMTPSPPPAPSHLPLSKSRQSFNILDEEDEILMVTTELEEDLHEIEGDVEEVDVNDECVEFQLGLTLDTLDRLSRDVQHLQARVQSIETIVVLRNDNKRKFLWWPFEELSPKTLLFMVTWPMVSHGLIYLALAAFKKSRH